MFLMLGNALGASSPLFYSFIYLKCIISTPLNGPAKYYTCCQTSFLNTPLSSIGHNTHTNTHTHKHTQLMCLL